MPGATRVVASRVVHGTREEIQSRVAHWMVEGETLALKRHHPDLIVWEQQRGFMARLVRLAGGERYHLARATDVAAALTPLPSGDCRVELAADVSSIRSRAIRAGVAIGGAFVVLGGTALALASVVVSAPVTLGLGGILLGSTLLVAPLVRRMQQEGVSRVALALEEALDRVEHEGVHA